MKKCGIWLNLNSYILWKKKPSCDCQSWTIIGKNTLSTKYGHMCDLRRSQQFLCGGSDFGKPGKRRATPWKTHQLWPICKLHYDGNFFLVLSWFCYFLEGSLSFFLSFFFSLLFLWGRGGEVQPDPLHPPVHASVCDISRWFISHRLTLCWYWVYLLFCFRHNNEFLRNDVRD